MKIDAAIKHFQTQSELAKILGLSPSAINRWKERGDLVPLKQAIKLNRLTNGEIDLMLADYHK